MIDRLSQLSISISSIKKEEAFATSSSRHQRIYHQQATCDIMSIQQNIYISAKLLTVGNYGNIIRVHEKGRYHLHYGRRILHSRGGCQETESLSREDQIHAEKRSAPRIQNWQPVAYRQERSRRLLGTTEKRPRRQKIKADISHNLGTVARLLLAGGSAIAAALDHATLTPIITCYFTHGKYRLTVLIHVSAKRIIGAKVARRVYNMSPFSLPSISPRLIAQFPTPSNQTSHTPLACFPIYCSFTVADDGRGVFMKNNVSYHDPYPTHYNESAHVIRHTMTNGSVKEEGVA